MQKKIIGSVLLILAIFVNYGAAYGAQLSKYVNPGDIIITQPADKTKTMSDKASILGAADFNYPLYLNGQKIPVTTNGFFAQYVDLKIGENKFTFTNNGKSKTLTITRTQASSVTSGALAKVTAFKQPYYGIVKSEYITHRANPNDSPELITPLAKGTTFKLLGETDSYYQIDGGTYVVKSVIDKKQGSLEPNVITRSVLSEDESFTSLTFDMNIKALYSIEMSGNIASLTIYAQSDKSDGVSIKDTDISDIQKLSDGNIITYNITFNDDALPVGYYVEYVDGGMAVRFRRAGQSSDGLKGMSVLLDAGHGGSDTGALGPPSVKGPKEKDFNLYVALTAKEYLESKGAAVYMIREDDTEVSLTNRVLTILGKKPDISVSVHTNSMPITADYNQVKGPLMFYTFNTGYNAASHILKYITDDMNTEYKEPRRSNLALTRITNCPAVLLEMSFMSNPDDYEWMLKEENLKAYGIALGMGIEDYLIVTE